MDDQKSKIETKENIKINLEEKQKPHSLLYIQQCMLYDQLDNPEINVHNLTRLYRYEKSKLDISKFIICFNKLIKHHPCYLTVLHKKGENDFEQIYRPELFKEIKLEKMSEKEFNEEVLPNILTNFHMNLFDNLLIRFFAMLILFLSISTQSNMILFPSYFFSNNGIKLPTPTDGSSTSIVSLSISGSILIISVINDLFV